MKRDPDLYREILLKIEQSENCPSEMIEIEVANRTGLEIAYHVKLLHDANFVEAEDCSIHGEFDWKPYCMTHEGHEFLDTIRDDKIWGATKIVAKKAGSGAVSFLWEIAKAKIKAETGLEF